MNNKSYNQNVFENEKRRIRTRSKKFMIKEIVGLQYLYTKDAKAPVVFISNLFKSFVSA
jgi:hypothetical protein